MLYERDTVPVFARVALTAAKLPEDQQVTALVDPRFPFNNLMLFADTSSETADSIAQPFPASAVRAAVTAWSPSQLSIRLTGNDTRTGHLLVSMN